MNTNIDWRAQLDEDERWYHEDAVLEATYQHLASPMTAYSNNVAEYEHAARILVDRLQRARWSMDPDAWLLVPKSALYLAVGYRGGKLLLYDPRVMYFMEREALRRLDRTPTGDL
jgi:hypothetical protein